MSNWKLPPDEALSLVESLLEDSRDLAEVSLKLFKIKSNFDRATLVDALNVVKARYRTRERRFPVWAHKGFFIPEVLEQGTHPEISEHHATTLGECNTILELGTGMGFDSAAFARRTKRVVSVEQDERCAQCARLNLKLQNLSNVEILCETAEHFISNRQDFKADALWADPSRREGGQRKNRAPSQYSPPLDWIMGLNIAPKIGIKISPAVHIDVADQFSREWVGFQGECKEQIIWKGLNLPPKQVTIIETNETFYQKEGFIYQGQNPVSPIWSGSPDGSPKFVISPHPALSASGLIQAFYCERRIENLDAETEHGYGVTSEKPSASGLFTAFEVTEIGAFSISSIQEAIDRNHFGPGSQIHKRGDTILPDELRSELRFDKAGRVGDILMARIGRKRVYLIGTRLYNGR